MARSFAGGTDTAKTAASVYNLSNPALTFSAWFNVTTFTALGSIFSTNGVSNNNIAWVKQATGKMQYVNVGGGTIIGGSHTISTGTWYHLAVTITGSSGTFAGYINGASDMSEASATGYNFTSIQFGNDPDTEPLEGLIADGAVWTTVLTAAEISALANGARPGQIRPASLLGWWPLDGLQSPEPDLSGNAKNLTLTGTSSAFGPPIMLFTPRWPQLLITSPPAPPPFTHPGRSPLEQQLRAFFAQPDPWVYASAGFAPYTPRQLDPAITAVPVNDPPFAHPARQPVGIALAAQTAWPDWVDKPWTYSFTGGRQPYAGAPLPPAILAVPVNNPPFAHPGRSVLEQQLRAFFAQPDPWVYAFAGFAPYTSWPLDPAIEAVPVNNPPFALRRELAQLMNVIVDWQEPPHPPWQKPPYRIKLRLGSAQILVIG